MTFTIPEELKYETYLLVAFMAFIVIGTILLVTVAIRFSAWKKIILSTYMIIFIVLIMAIGPHAADKYRDQLQREIFAKTQVKLTDDNMVDLLHGVKEGESRVYKKYRFTKNEKTISAEPLAKSKADKK